MGVKKIGVKKKGKIFGVKKNGGKKKLGVKKKVGVKKNVIKSLKKSGGKNIKKNHQKS